MAKKAEVPWPPFYLNTGTTMPSIGLSTEKHNNEQHMKNYINEALRNGYRCLETSAAEGNETLLGHALEELLPMYDLTRQDIFIARKLDPREMYTPSAIQQILENSLRNLGTEYLDLVIFGYPGASYTTSLKDKHKTVCINMWTALTELYDAGKVNALGVKKFSATQLRELTKLVHSAPAVYQVTDCRLDQHDLEVMNVCREHDILLQKYSPVDDLDKSQPFNSKTTKIASELDVTPTQVLLVWNLQSEIQAMIETTQPKIMETCSQLQFRLTDRQTKMLNNKSS